MREGRKKIDQAALLELLTAKEGIRSLHGNHTAPPPQSVASQPPCGSGFPGGLCAYYCWAAKALGPGAQLTSSPRAASPGGWGSPKSISGAAPELLFGICRVAAGKVRGWMGWRRPFCTLPPKREGTASPRPRRREVGQPSFLALGSEMWSH